MCVHLSFLLLPPSLSHVSFPNTCSPSHTVSDICIVVWTWLGIVRPWSDLAVLSIWGPSSLPSSHLFMSSFTLVFPFSSSNLFIRSHHPHAYNPGNISLYHDPLLYPLPPTPRPMPCHDICLTSISLYIDLFDLFSPLPIQSCASSLP